MTPETRPPSADHPLRLFAIGPDDLADTVPFPVWVSGGRSENNWVNRSMAEFTGHSAEEHAGEGWLEVIHPDDRAGYLELAQGIWADPRPYECVYRLRRADGEWRDVLNRGVPWFENGELVAFVGGCVDITDQVRSLASAEEENRRFEFLVGVLSGLVGAGADALPGALASVVETIGRFASVDRVGLVRIDRDSQTMELDHFWSSQATGPAPDAPRSVPLAAQPTFNRSLGSLEIVMCDDVGLLGEEHAVEREFLAARGIRASAQVPIVLGGEVHMLNL